MGSHHLVLVYSRDLEGFPLVSILLNTMVPAFLVKKLLKGKDWDLQAICVELAGTL